MKRKHAPRCRIGYDQLENRRLLAAIANGQEIESSIPIGGAEMFELSVDVSGPIHFLVSPASIFPPSSDTPQAAVTVTDPSENTVAVRTRTFPSGAFSDPLLVTFIAEAPGTYSFQVSELGNDQPLDFGVRALAVLETFDEVAGRDAVLTNGGETAIDIPPGRMSVYTFDATAGSNVLFSAGYQSSSDIGGVTVLTLYDSVGNTLYETTSFLGFDLPTNLLVQPDAAEHYVLVTENLIPFPGPVNPPSIRVVSLPGNPQLIPTRDFALPFDAEITSTNDRTRVSIHAVSVNSLEPFEITNTETAWANEIRLFDPSGNLVANGIEAGATNRLVYEPLVTGEYTALITAGYGERVTRFGSLPESVALINGEEKVVNLAAKQEVTFTLPVMNAGTVLVSAGDVSDDLPSSITVYGPDGSQLVTGENERVTRVDFTADAPGDYQIVVTNESNVGQRDFRVRAFAVRDDMTLTPGLDGVLSNGTKTSTTINSGSFGIFNIELTESGRTLVSTSGLRGSATSIRLFDAAGNELQETDFDSDNHIQSFAASIDQPQTYTAVVVPGPSIFDDSDVTVDVRRVSLNEEFAPDAENLTLIQNGDTMSGSFDSGGFAVVALQTQTSGAVHFAVNRADLYAELTIIDSDGETILGTDWANNSRLSTAQALVSEAGTSYAIVNGIVARTSPAPRDFQIRGISVPGNPILVDGKDAVLQSGDLVESALVEGETGVFFLNVEADEVGPVILTLKEVYNGSVFSPPVTAFGPDGSRIELASMPNAGSNHFTFLAEQQGQYTIFVAEANKTFTIQADVIPGESTLANGDETFEPIADRQAKVFAFDVDQTGPVYAHVNVVGAVRSRISVQILNDRGEPVQSSTLYGGDTVSFNLVEFVALETGTYFAVVDNASIDGDGDIRFRTVTLTGEPQLIPGRDASLANGVLFETVGLDPQSASVFRFEVTAVGPIALFGNSATWVFDPAGNRISDFAPYASPFIATAVGTYTAISIPFDSASSFRHVEVLSEPSLISGREAFLSMGNEAESALPIGQSAVFPLQISQPGPVRVYVGQTERADGEPAISVYDDLGSRVAFDDDRNFGLSTVVASFHAQPDRSYFAIVQENRTGGTVAINVIVRLVGITATNELIPDRDFIVGEHPGTRQTVPGLGVTLAELNIEQPGELKFFYNGEDLTVFDPSGQEIGVGVEDGILTLTATQRGRYLMVERGFSVSIRPFSTQPDNDRVLTEGLDQPLQNGQEISGTLLAGGISVIPLDIDFAGYEAGYVTVAGTSESGSVIPLVQIFDVDGNEVATNERFSVPSRNDIGLFSRFTPSEPRYAVVTNSTSSETIDFTIRAANFAHPLALVPGRETFLEDGVPFTAQSLEPGFFYFPFEVETPGTVTVDFTSTTISVGSGGFHMQLINPAGQLTYYSPSINTEFEITEPGSYGIFLRHLGTSQLEFEIIVNEIARAKPAVTSSLRDGRLGSRAEVLAQPDAVDQLTFQFNQDVAIQADDLVLRNDSNGGELVDVSGASFSYDPTTLTATWDLLTLDVPLPAGIYATSLVGEGITSVSSGKSMANDFSHRFQVALPGDTNFDGVVDVLNDAAVLISNLNRTGLLTWADSNFNGDGSIDVLNDAAALVNNLGGSIVPTEVVGFERDGRETALTTSLGRPDLAETLTVDFSVNVDVSASDLVLRNDTIGALVAIPETAFSYDAANRRATLSLTELANPLSPGYYSIDILASSVTNVATGQSLLQDVHDEFYVALPGDTNYDGKVDVLTDAATLIQNLGRIEFATWQRGDFNDDGQVDILGDAAALINSLGQSVERDQAFAGLI